MRKSDAIPFPEPPSSRRQWLVAAVKMLVAFGLLALVIVLNREQIREVLTRKLDLRFFLIGFVLYLSGMMLAFVRWAFYVRALNVPFRIRDGLRLGFVANLFNFVVPGGPVGGDVVRAAFLCREQAAWKTRSIASVVLDRLVGLLGLFLLACVAGTVAWHRLDRPVRRLVIVAWVVSLVVVTLLAIGFSPALYRPLSRRFAGRKRLARRLNELVATGTLYRERLGIVLLGLAMAMTTHSLIILSFYAASRALFPAIPSLAEHFTIVPLILVTTAVPLPFGALGLSEGISAHLFGLAAYPGGAVAMMGFRVVQYATAVISACVYATNRQQVRTLTRTAEILVDQPQG
jgi:glycosyltransferase 2 family protein